jgi:hypothetical protein
MTETARFMDGTQFTESQMAEVLRRIIRDGLCYASGGGAGLELQVTAPGGMFVRVASGEAFIQGFWYKNDANINLTVPANATGSTRLDYVVLHVDPSANTINVQYKTGTVSLPTLTQIDGGVWEYAIASVSVANGAGSISGGNITDVRKYVTRVAVSGELAAGVVNTPALATGAVNAGAIAANAVSARYAGSSVAGAATASRSPVLLYRFSVTTTGGDVFMIFSGFGSNPSQTPCYTMMGRNNTGTPTGLAYLAATSEPSVSGYVNMTAGMLWTGVPAGPWNFDVYFYSDANTLSIGGGQAFLVEIGK